MCVFFSLTFFFDFFGQCSSIIGNEEIDRIDHVFGISAAIHVCSANLELVAFELTGAGQSVSSALHGKIPIQVILRFISNYYYKSDTFFVWRLEFGRGGDDRNLMPSKMESFSSPSGACRKATY